jgi:hypothetical protein
MMFRRGKSSNAAYWRRVQSKKHLSGRRKN